MKIIPINNGYYQIKSIDNQIFKSRLSKNTYGSIQGNVDTLELMGEKYIVGAGKVNLNMDKTNNEFTKIFVLNMLGRFCDSSDEFKICISSPPLVYGQQKEILPEYLEGKYEVVHNGKLKKIEIDIVKVYPETIMAYQANKNRFKGRNVIVIDVGGLTTIIAQIRGGSFTKDDIATIRKGMYNLDFKVSQYLNAEHTELNCDVDDIQYFRNCNDNVMNDERIVDIYREHIDEIIEIMDFKGFNYNSDSYEVLITGGGGLVLYEFIRKFFMPKVILSNDPIMDNLNGLEDFAKKVFKI